MFRHHNILCKAKANLSGNVPNSSQGGLSEYESVIETLTTLFPVWVCFLSKFLVCNGRFCSFLFHLLYIFVYYYFVF
ncbi:hypothetical protein Syun_027635 [Stephania yunnanensis]|uniref:Uncharacterized protein n=1 Tax=Stephania yunnanensis TaxID=152371 RepID=A0AAP0EPU1_9MAGN